MATRTLGQRDTTLARRRDDAKIDDHGDSRLIIENYWDASIALVEQTGSASTSYRISKCAIPMLTRLHGIQWLFSGEADFIAFQAQRKRHVKPNRSRESWRNLEGKNGAKPDIQDNT